MAPGQADSGEDSQAFAGSRWRRAVSEGSLFPTLAGNLETKCSQRGGEGRGCHERVGKVGGGSGSFARVKDGIRRRDLEGGGGVVSSLGEE